MATPARKPRARRPFVAVASLSAARNRVMASENIEPDGMSFAQCLHRFKKFSGEPTKPVMAPVVVAGKADVKNKKCCSTPVSKKSASRAPRTASRRRLDGSSSRKVSTPAAAAYDAPRAPLWDFSDEFEKKVRARLSSPIDVSEQSQERGSGNGVREEGSRKRTTMSVTTLEEAMAGLPEPGEGRVRYLVDTFERLLSLSGGREADNRGARRRKKDGVKAASAASSPRKADEMDMMSYPSVASSSDVSYNVGFSDSNSRRISSRDQRQLRKCYSTGSSERSCSRKVTRVTRQRPFNLRTEQRGKVKEDNFVQRMRKMLQEEEKLGCPLAQGLPWTTDEPENPAKPPVKEPTEPCDVVLHSAARAIAERNIFLEKLELEKERQQKMEEEIEIKVLRKEQVKKAHPMPDFSRPFVPKRSVKPQTVPREPRFQHRLMRHSSKT